MVIGSGMLAPIAGIPIMFCGCLESARVAAGKTMNAAKLAAREILDTVLTFRSQLQKLLSFTAGPHPTSMAARSDLHAAT